MIFQVHFFFGGVKIIKIQCRDFLIGVYENHVFHVFCVRKKTPIFKDKIRPGSPFGTPFRVDFRFFPCLFLALFLFRFCCDFGGVLEVILVTFLYLKGPRSDKVYFLKTIEFLKENIGFRGSKATEREPNQRFLTFLSCVFFGTDFGRRLGSSWEAFGRHFGDFLTVKIQTKIWKEKRGQKHTGPAQPGTVRDGSWEG